MTDEKAINAELAYAGMERQKCRADALEAELARVRSTAAELQCALEVTAESRDTMRESVTRISEEHGFLILKHEGTCAEADKLRTELEAAEKRIRDAERVMAFANPKHNFTREVIAEWIERYGERYFGCRDD